MARVTIHEIARLAGVSIGTVSRALNNRPGVSEETRQAILGLVGRMGYVPDAGARRLAQGHKQLVGVAPFSENAVRSPYYSYLLDAIQETVYQNGYVARVLEADPADPVFRDCAGFILPGVHLDDARVLTLVAHAVPVVVINRVEAGIPWLDIDNRGGIRQALQHLLRLGHRRIAHLTGSPIGQTTQARLSTYQEFVREHGLDSDPALVLDGAFTDLGAYRAVRQAWEEGLRFTAVAAASDEMALGAILALGDLGLRVPLDVSVTGFDDLPSVRYAQPALTTVRQPIREVGQTAAELLLENLEGQPPRSLVLPTELVVRASTSAAKEG